MKFVLPMLALALVAGCRTTDPVLEPLPQIGYDAGLAGSRENGRVGTPTGDGRSQVSLAPSANVFLRQPGAPGSSGGGGDITLDFADTDIRDVVGQILGTTLGKTYTVDPAVRGTVTLRTAQPLSRDQLLPVLRTLLAQNGAALIESNDIFRVLPAAAAQTTGGIATGSGDAGTLLVQLRYASADTLAKTLAPFVQNGGRILPDAATNALVVSGDPTTRQTLIGLISAFDIDVLSGQSYALLPVTSGDAKDFATAMQDALRGAGGGLGGTVQVIPMARIAAVLVVSRQPRYVEEAQRIYGLVERKRRSTVRAWHVYYLQNGRSNDTAYVLQQAFTPNSVTAVPTPSGASARNIATQQQAGFGSNGGGGAGGGLTRSGGGGLGTGGTGLGGGGGVGGTGLGAGLGAGAAPGAAPAAPASGNPLLGGLDPAEGGSGSTPPDGMRIIPNGQNNALLIYGTQQENDTVEAMLRKLDILPLQVRIDATIAEVTLNDQLQYGTQFFFKAGLQGALSFGTAAAAFASGFPGFVLSGPNNTSGALSLLQSVTKVRVLSSPQLLVLDNEAARLQVGALVPYLSQTAQSTLTTGSPVINSINYQQTGVIMQVTPRVNTGGLVTLDIQQEVSDVDPTVTTPGVNSPTFNERSVTSRVVIQDGQTVGLAGLIRDSDSRNNAGIPWFKDIPLLGALLGQQNNNRGRTELLVLITPHVVHDQRDARALTQDLRDQLSGAALTPQILNALPASGSADPNAELRRRAGLHR